MQYNLVSYQISDSFKFKQEGFYNQATCSLFQNKCTIITDLSAFGLFSQF